MKARKWLGVSAGAGLAGAIGVCTALAQKWIPETWGGSAILLFGGILGAIWATWLAHLVRMEEAEESKQNQLKEIAYQVYWELVAGMNLADHYVSQNFKQLVRLPCDACKGVLRSGIGIPRQVGSELVRYLEKIAVMNSEIEIFLSGVTVVGPTVNEATVDRVRRGALNELKNLSETQLFPQAKKTVQALKAAGLIPQDYAEDFKETSPEESV